MNQTTQSDKDFLRNDRRLVCGMFLFYGLCILGLIGAAIWGLTRRNMTISVNATSTAFAVATRQANATATAVMHATEQAQYEIIDPFDGNKRDWRVGTEDNKYWSGYTTIVNGAYLWDIKDSKDGFISWSDFSDNEFIHDFDVYVDTKVAKGESGKVCSGFLFRKASSVDEYYYFALCNNAAADISFLSAKDEWERIAALPSLFSYSKEWNRLEISARGQHFVFRINGNTVYEMDDDRRETGGIALVIEVSEKSSARVLFDNFGFQYR